MEKHRYINDILLSFFETIPLKDLDGIVSQFVLARKSQYPRATKLINSKDFKKLDSKNKIEKLISLINYNVNDDYILLLIDSSYNYYYSNISLFSYENYEQAVEHINKDNYIYLIIYIIYKYCKPPYKAKLIEFFKSIEEKNIREQKEVSDSSATDLINSESNMNEIMIEDDKNMKYYVGYIEKKSTFYNFKPEYELIDGKLQKVENVLERYPKHGKINLSYKYYEESGLFLKNLDIDYNNKTFNNLYVLKTNDADLEDNNEYVQKKIDLQKIIATGAKLNDIIIPIEKKNVYRVVTPTSFDIEENFIEGNILINEDYDANTQALLLYKDKLYGPYTIEERSYDSQKYVNPELINSKDPYLRKYIDANILKIACNDGFDSYSHNVDEIDIALFSEDFIRYEDLIPENVLAEELGKIYTFTINSDKDNYSEILNKLIKSSKFFGDTLPEKIREERIEKSEKLFSNLQNLSSSQKKLIDNLLSEEVLKNNAEIYSSFEKLLIRSEKYREMEAKVNELTELSDNLNKEIDELKKCNKELNEHAESIHADEYLTKEKEDELQKLRSELDEKNYIIEKYKNTMDVEEDIISKKEELEKLKAKLNDTKIIIKDRTTEKNELENELKNLQREVKNALSNASEADVVFNPYVASVMLDKVTELQKSKKQSDYKDMIPETEPLNESENKIEENKAIDYLVEGIQKYRNYERNDIINIFICVSQSFLTIFAGNPGTGKTTICNILGYSLGLNRFKKDDKDNKGLNRFIEVSVERGWSSKRDLIGYFNPLTRTYDKSNGKIYDALKLLDAECNTEQKSEYPFYILLDEANLSPIEYYWAAFMSIADDNKDRFTINIGEDEDIQIPETLHFLATINNDQTTEPLSPRLLDRAWVIKLPEIAMDYEDKPNLKDTFTKIFSWKQVKNLFVENTVNEIKKDYLDVLESIYSSFNNAGLSVSPRIKQSIRKYISVAQKLMDSERSSAQGEEVAIDFAVLQKLLPKINGNINGFKKLFTELKSICNENHLFRTQAAIKKMEEQQERNMGFCQYL